MVWGEVALALLREIVRALGFPLQMLAFLPVSARWRARAQQMLAATDPDPEASLREFLAQARAPARTPGPGQGAAPPRPHLFVSAGESSGDLHAAALIRALREQGLDPRCTGFGGARMRDVGVSIRYPLSEHAVMGFVAVLAHLPRILGVFARYLRLLRDDPPELVVLVDFPGLHLVMGRAARRRGIPVVHYVAPQYWAWAPWRIRRYRRCVDVALTILPFEPAFFREQRIPAVYVGHPLLDQPQPAPALAGRPDGEAPLVLLPGSRTHDIRLHLAGLLQVAAGLASGLASGSAPRRVIVAHTDERKAPLIRQLVAAGPALDAAGGVQLVVGPLAPLLGTARAVIAKSGTGSLESCLAGAPTLVVYRAANVTMRWLRRYLIAPFFASANLIAGREIVPERLVFRDADWPLLAPVARALLEDGPTRERCRADLAEMRRRLGSPGASARAARVVAALLAGGAR